MEYRPRVADALVADRLTAVGGVLIEGARATGKTATGLRHAASSVRLDQSPVLAMLARDNPTELLAGEAPRLVDEWQLAPTIWNAIRHEIDDRATPGQFILSGSSSPPADPGRHSGAGRISRVRMRPMALAESGASDARVSLSALANGLDQVSATSPLSYRELAEEAVRGGWPALLGASSRDAMRFNRDYADELTRVDIPAGTGVRHEPARMLRTLIAVSRNLATEASLATLAADIGVDSAAIDSATVGDYLEALTRVFLYEELPAWSPHLRSRTRLRVKSTMHLADPSLACALVGADPDRLAQDPEFFGFVLESMAIRDLRTYAAADDGRVLRYRDETNLEVDAIIEYPGPRWAAIEVKLGQSGIESAERQLLKLRDDRIDTRRAGDAAFLAIVTGTEYAYTLPSGVHVVPLATLGP